MLGEAEEKLLHEGPLLSLPLETWAVMLDPKR
jgi:hypothetical protein